MSNTLFDTDLDIVVEEELKKLPPCETATGQHSRGVWGHVPTDPAAYLAIHPCGHSSFKCRGWTENPRHTEYVLCLTGCGERHLFTDYVFVPLEA